ncbi:helix-turn-helix domain-containing protein, partial [Singulisphaera rosea]
ERIAQARSEHPGPLEIGGAMTLEQMEVEHIRRVLATSPNLDAAAKTLGIDPSTLYRKRKQHGL